MSLKELRIKRGVSQRYVSEKIGMTQQQYCKFEQGKSRIDFVKGVKLAKVLGVKLDELIKHL